MMDAIRAMQRARSLLLCAHPFYGELAMRLELKQADNLPAPMATDGKSLMFNPELIREWTTAETIGVIAHEIEHIARGHLWRKGDRHWLRWNIAADMQINYDLTHTKYDETSNFVLPKGGVEMFSDNFIGKSAEWTYDNLPVEIVHVQFTDFGAMTEGEADERPMLEAEWNAAIVEAAKKAAEAGTLPGHFQRIIQNIEARPVNWRAEILQFAQERRKEDYSWARPNRRMAALDFYMPSLYSEDVPSLGLILDTSASISPKALNLFGSYIGDIHATCRPGVFWVLYTHTHVYKSEEFGPDDILSLSEGQDGGTDLRTGFEWFSENGHEPAAIIVLTDLETPFPDDPGIPTLWASVNPDIEAPFGKTIYIDFAKELGEA